MNIKTIRIYKCGDGVYSAEILVPGFIDVWAPLRGPNGDTLFESKDEAIKAAKLELGRRRASSWRSRRRSGSVQVAKSAKPLGNGGVNVSSRQPDA
jgi:hypothetical protein